IGDKVIGPMLRDLAARHPSVGEVRGLGVFWAVELVRDPTTREPLVPFNASGESAAPMAELAASLRSNGVWPFTHFNPLHFVPPCNVKWAAVEEGAAPPHPALPHPPHL